MKMGGVIAHVLKLKIKYMKTKFIKVSVEERLPKSNTSVILIDEYNVSCQGYLSENNNWIIFSSESHGNIEFWLEEVPDREDEMREILQNLLSLKYCKDKDGKTPYYLEEMPKTWEKAEQLLNELKETT